MKEACQINHLEMVQLLLQYGADPDNGIDGVPPLQYAVQSNNTDLIELLLGAGADIAAARRPALVEVAGTRVAFLAYSSILPAGYWAEHDRPGCAPMRALTLYQQVEVDQPGTPARIHTYPDRADLKALRTDVRRARQEADFVVVSIHWGIHFVPSEIADYQRDVAYAAIDDGAGAVCAPPNPWRTCAGS